MILAPPVFEGADHVKATELLPAPPETFVGGPGRDGHTESLVNISASR
jgi:hypothetical protein